MIEVVNSNQMHSTRLILLFEPPQATWKGSKRLFRTEPHPKGHHTALVKYMADECGTSETTIDYRVAFGQVPRVRSNPSQYK